MYDVISKVEKDSQILKGLFDLSKPLLLLSFCNGFPFCKSAHLVYCIEEYLCSCFMTRTEKAQGNRFLAVDDTPVN